MNRQPNALRLRIYSLETDKVGHVPLHEYIVTKAHEHSLAGATVLRGIMGFGSRQKIHSAKFVQLAVDLPLVTELVDEATRIRSFFDEVVSGIAGVHATFDPVEWIW